MSENLDDLLAQLEAQAIADTPQPQYAQPTYQQPPAQKVQTISMSPAPAQKVQTVSMSPAPGVGQRQALNVQTTSVQQPAATLTPAAGSVEKKPSSRSTGSSKSSTHKSSSGGSGKSSSGGSGKSSGSKSSSKSGGKSSSGGSSRSRTSKPAGHVAGEAGAPNNVDPNVDWDDEMADILGIDFSTGPKSGETHPYGANMLEMLGFTRFDPRLALPYDEDDNVATDFSIRGTDSTLVGEVHFVNLVPKGDDGEPVALKNPQKYISTDIIHQTTGNKVAGWWRDNGDNSIALGFYAEQEGDLSFTVLLTGNPIISLPMHVAEAGDVKQWFCQYERPVLGEVWKIHISRKDKKQPEGIVDLMAERTNTLANFKIKKIGPGKYRITSIPIKVAAVQVHITILGEHISGSPIQTFVVDPEAAEGFTPNWAEQEDSVTLTPASVDMEPMNAQPANASGGPGMMGGGGPGMVPMGGQGGMMGGPGMMGGQMGMGGPGMMGPGMMGPGMRGGMGMGMGGPGMMMGGPGMMGGQMGMGGGMGTNNPMMTGGGMMGGMGTNNMMGPGMRGGMGMGGPGMMGGQMGGMMGGPGGPGQMGATVPGLGGGGGTNDDELASLLGELGPVGTPGAAMGGGMGTNNLGGGQPQQMGGAPKTNDDELAALLGELM